MNQQEKDQIQYQRMVNPKAFRAGQKDAIHEVVKLALKLAFRIILVIALAVGVLAVIS